MYPTNSFLFFFLSVHYILSLAYPILSFFLRETFISPLKIYLAFFISHVGRESMAIYSAFRTHLQRHTHHWWRFILFFFLHFLTLSRQLLFSVKHDNSSLVNTLSCHTFYPQRPDLSSLSRSLFFVFFSPIIIIIVIILLY